MCRIVSQALSLLPVYALLATRPDGKIMTQCPQAIVRHIMVDLNSGRSAGLSAGDGQVSVLVVDDCQSAGPEAIARLPSEIDVIDTVRTGDEDVEKLSVRPPDVFLMVADNPTPTPLFQEAIAGLSSARLEQRVMMMVSNPASYLGLAIKTRAAVLLPMHAAQGTVVSAMREVRAWSRDTAAGRASATVNRDSVSPETGGD